MNNYQSTSDLIETLAAQKNKIIKEINDAWATCDFNLREPEIIRNFVMVKNKGVDYLNKNLAAHINKIQTRFVLKFGGVYAHQRPYICRDKNNIAIHQGSNLTEKCELADLLCIAVFVDNKKEVIASQASFFQAKKTEAIDNQTQRWLYDFDDRFDYEATSFWQKTAPNISLRTLPSWVEQRATAFQYLLLKNGDVSAKLSPWSVAHKHRFAFFLYRLLTFSAGKPYLSNDQSTGGWSSIVNDVLRMASSKMGGKPRNSPDLDELLDYFNDFRKHDRFSWDIPSGVPILIAILQDTAHH